MKPYHMHPRRPSSHRPPTLDAKLRLVPNTHTSMSLTLMFNKSKFTGVRSVLNLQKRTKTIKLFKKPKVMMNPSTTDSAMNPDRDSVSTGESRHSSYGKVNGSSPLVFIENIFEIVRNYFWISSGKTHMIFSERLDQPCASLCY